MISLSIFLFLFAVPSAVLAFLVVVRGMPFWVNPRKFWYYSSLGCHLWLLTEEVSEIFSLLSSVSISCIITRASYGKGKFRSGDFIGERGFFEGVIILLFDIVFLSGCWRTSSAMCWIDKSLFSSLSSEYFPIFFLEVDAPTLLFLCWLLTASKQIACLVLCSSLIQFWIAM